MERLINNEILHNLDFTDLNICVDCINKKQTKHTKKRATRSTRLLEIVHIDICGPFDVNSLKRKNTLSPLLIIVHVMIVFTYCMRNIRQWMP